VVEQQKAAYRSEVLGLRNQVDHKEDETEQLKERVKQLEKRQVLAQQQLQRAKLLT